MTGERNTPARPGLVSLTWPLFAELLLGTLVGLAGLTLAARVSDTASGAYAMANHVQQAFFLLFRIVSMGVSVVITQQLGAGDRAGADASARAALGASSWLGLGAGVAVAAGAGGLLRLMNVPAAVLPLAQPFLQWLALGLALDAYNASMAAVMRAHLHARDTLFVMLVMHGLHLLLCVPLMDGLGPVPALGLQGFAVALAASRALGLVLHLWLWRRRLSLAPTRRDWWVIRRARLAPVLHIGLPGAAENIAWRLAMMVTVALVAGMGVPQLAAQAYTLQIQHFVLLFGVAVGFASEILVGHLIGAGRLHEADRLVHKSMRWGLAMGTVGALAAALSAPWTLSLFTRDAQVVAWGIDAAVDRRAARARPRVQPRGDQRTARLRRRALPGGRGQPVHAGRDGRRRLAAGRALRARPARRMDRLRRRRMAARADDGGTLAAARLAGARPRHAPAREPCTSHHLSMK